MTGRIAVIPTIVIDKVDSDEVARETSGQGWLKVENEGHEKVRAKSIDFGKIFSSSSSSSSFSSKNGGGQRGNEKDSLLHSDDENSEKDKTKNKFFRKFNNMLSKRRGSDSTKPEKSKTSLDFSNAQPTSLMVSSTSQLNNDTDELQIPVQLPRRGSLFVQPKGTIQHKVDKEDTLPSLAARYKSTVTELKSLNRLMCTMLCPGQIIFVPDGSARENRRASDFYGEGAGGMVAPGLKFGSRPGTPSVLDKVDEEDRICGVRSKKNSVFSGEAKYMTGGEVNLSGLLTITDCEVRFDPYRKRKKDGKDDKDGEREAVDGGSISDEINTIIGLVKYKMSTACLLHSASFHAEDPFQRKSADAPEEGENKAAMFTVGGAYDVDPEEEVNGEPETNFVRLTLVRKLKSAKPFVEALVKMCVPLPNYMEHFFKLKPQISKDLQKFLGVNFPEALNASVPDPLTLKVMDIKAQVKNSNLRRKLSIAELCNLALPSLSETSHIFNDGHVRVLREFIPPKFDGRPWQLAYATWKNGFSLKTLYRCMDKYRDEEVALITVKDTCSEVFGGLLCGGIARSESFYGTGESFLFTFSPSFQIYPWSRKNECFARGTPDSFIMGSSEGAIGLWIDDDLLHGTTNRCDTFDNDPLASSTDFTITCLEVWTFPYELY